MSITAERSDARTAEILERIKEVFAAKGFDGASMQDLARGAGMSAGNFYRYFSSKNAIVEAMVLRDLEEVEANFAAILTSESPKAALRTRLRERMETFAAEDGPLWAEIDAAAARKPEIAEISTRVVDAATDHLLRVFSMLAKTTLDDARVRFSAHAQFLVLLFKATSMTPCRPYGRCARRDPALMNLVLRTIDQLIDEVAAGAETPHSMTEDRPR